MVSMHVLPRRCLRTHPHCRWCSSTRSPYTETRRSHERILVGSRPLGHDWRAIAEPVSKYIGMGFIYSHLGEDGCYSDKNTD
jgi:hypothetical protein